MGSSSSGEVKRLRAILAHAWADAIKHDSGCGCSTCTLAREAITREDAERILWPTDGQGEAFGCPGCGGHWRRDQLGPTPDILRCPNCGEFCKPEPGEA